MGRSQTRPAASRRNTGNWRNFINLCRRAARPFPAVVLCALLICAATAGPSPGQTYWQHDPATPGDSEDPANWTMGVPVSSGDLAYVDNGGTAVITDGTRTIHTLRVAQSGSGQILQSGGYLVWQRYVESRLALAVLLRQA